LLRRFRTHDLRHVDDLRGVWDFAFLGKAEPDEVDPAAIRFTDRMAVPGSFDATPRYAGRRGLAAYRTRILVRDATLHRLVLDGVHHWCRIFAGGRRIRDHVGGFTSFAADLAGLPPGEVELTVLVDNRLDYRRCPLHLDYFDWYHHGGICRAAEVHRLGRLWIDRLEVTTLDCASRRMAVRVHYASAAPVAEADLEIACDGRRVLARRVTLGGQQGALDLEIALPGAALWSPEEPNLHLLHVRLGDDDQRERIGIRQVKTAGQQILINGRPVRLLGFNRHELHPLFGHGQPDQILVQDVQLLKDCGSNFVRGSHYAQDVRFLDLCDEAGLCVWCEALGWQLTAEHLRDRHFLDAQLIHIEEMVAAAINRPSVIIWGMLNESHSHDPAARPAYQELLGKLRQLDPSRPVTYACNHVFDDQCCDLTDIVSLNVYPGWYSASIEEIPEQLDKAIGEQDRRGFSDKPIIISEIGAEGLYGWRDWNADRWSEQYQARLLETVIRHLFIDRGRVCGLAIWLFNDFRSSEAVRRAVSRGRMFNNKGVVDEYRRPKLSYDAVQRLFRQLGGAAKG
jgi:beta-glucuronidase